MQSDLAQYGQLVNAYVIDPDMDKARMVESIMRDELSVNAAYEVAKMD